MNDGDWGQLTYRFEDVVATLNAVQPYDWSGFLKTRLASHGPGAPLDGVARGGYRLVYAEKPTAYFIGNETRRKITDLTFSLGVSVNREGEVTAVQWDGPAFKAGLVDGEKIVAVNGVAFDGDRLKAAVTAAKGSAAPLELIIKSGDRYRVTAIPYHDGLRYPRFERVAGAPDRLGDILAAKR